MTNKILFIYNNHKIQSNLIYNNYKLVVDYRRDSIMQINGTEL
jgi:hypothetical protein